MLAEQPQVARPGVASSGAAGTSSGSHRPFFRPGSSSWASSIRIEAEQVEVVVQLLQFGQLDGQQVVIPTRQFGCLVVGDAVGFDLGW